MHGATADGEPQSSTCGRFLSGTGYSVGIAPFEHGRCDPVEYLRRRHNLIERMGTAVIIYPGPNAISVHPSQRVVSLPDALVSDAGKKPDNPLLIDPCRLAAGRKSTPRPVEIRRFSGAGQQGNGQRRGQQKPHHVPILQRKLHAVVDLDQPSRRDPRGARLGSGGGNQPER